MDKSLSTRARKLLSPKRVFGLWIKLWPDAAKAVLARAIADDKVFVRKHGHRLIVAMAPECGIVSLRAMGEYGAIVSDSHDSGAFLEYAQKGSWAEGTNATLGEFFDARGGGSYLDIGANIGLTTIPIAQRRPSVACYAFEPDPANFRNLSTNVAANCAHGNVKLFQTAVFDRRAEVKFELAPNNLADHRIRLKEPSVNRLGEDERRTITVPAAPLDQLVDEIHGPLAVKIDTQGAEPFVVAGGARTLAKADLLVMEWAPYYMARLGGDPRIVLDLLRKNFSRGRINQAERDPTENLRPMSEVCNQLEQTIIADSNWPRRYLDVTAVKA